VDNSATFSLQKNI